MITHVYQRRRGGDGALREVAEHDHGQPQTAVDVQSCELVWVDIDQPVPDDIAWLERTFGFHHLALEDVARRHQRAKIEEYAGYYFCVIYAARTDLTRRRISPGELEFFWGENYLVSIHTEPFPEITDLAARARDGTLGSVVGAGNSPLLVADLVYRLLDTIVDGYFPAVDALAEWTEDIEEMMFAADGDRVQETLQAIFQLRKDLIQLRKTISPSRESVNVLLRRDNALFGNEFVPYFQDVYDHTVRSIDTLDTYRDLLSTALETHLSIVSNEVSETVKRMTAITAILMVNALVAGIYGMNFDRMPELHWEFGYPWALGVMAVMSLGLWLLFRRIQWF